tara:strand:+ start:829 stop:1224 length:396 start_codon:yes stop_codon:yes gene_type:complete
MGVAIKFRKGTASEHASFAGEAGEVTVQTDASSGKPWSLRVHDGTGGSGHHIPAATEVVTLTNKTLTNVVLTGTIKDSSGNLLGTVVGGKLVLGSGALTLDAPKIVDQGTTKDLETMVNRVARKTQMILGD